MPTASYENLIDLDHLAHFKTRMDTKYATKEELSEVASRPDTIEHIKVNNVEATITEETVNITVPTTVAELSDSGNYATKADLSSAVNYRGSVATYDLLPSSGLSNGDMYNVADTNMNYIWNGTAWDPMSEMVDISGKVDKSDVTLATNAQIDALFS